jgi:hypothetical protein
MKALSTALAVLTWAVIASVNAQTADDIVTKYFNAIGGKEKIAGINTLYQEQTVEVMNNQAASTTIIVNGKGFKNEIDFGGQKIINCVTDKGGWSINPMLGQSTPTPMTDEQFNAAKDQLDLGGPLLNYAKKGNKVELAGRENLNGVETYKVKVTTTGNVESTYYFDPKTFYMLKNVSKLNVNGQDFETSIVFSDYRKTDYGNMLPYTVEMNLPQGFTIKTNVTKVEVNKQIDEKVFSGQ